MLSLKYVKKVLDFRWMLEKHSIELDKKIPIKHIEAFPVVDIDADAEFDKAVKKYGNVKLVNMPDDLVHAIRQTELKERGLLG